LETYHRAPQAGTTPIEICYKMLHTSVGGKYDYTSSRYPLGSGWMKYGAHMASYMDLKKALPRRQPEVCRCLCQFCVFEFSCICTNTFYFSHVFLLELAQDVLIFER
jgi:hypothetical protein